MNGHHRLAAALAAAACLCVVLPGCGDPRRASIDSGAAGADAGGDADRPPPRDAGDPSFECDPIETGIFVIGNQLDRESVPRLLGSYDPRTRAFTELADVRSCIEGWYVRGLTVSRDGVAHILLANQTFAAYEIESGRCDVQPLARSIDDGLYVLTTFVGTGSSSMSPEDERLLVAYRGYGDSDPVEVIELDPVTRAETPLAVLEFGSTQLISLAGTSDGRIFATRSHIGGDPARRDVVELELAPPVVRVVATTPARPEVWFRTAVALWDSQIFVFDATGTPSISTTVSSVDPRSGTWGTALLTLDEFELQAVSTTTCVGIDLI